MNEELPPPVPPAKIIKRIRATEKQRKTPHGAFPYPATPDRIPETIRTARRQSGGLVYQCPEACWPTHFRAWQHAYSKDPSNKEIPEPFPFFHVLFGY
jgi:hypothetical protein